MDDNEYHATQEADVESWNGEVPPVGTKCRFIIDTLEDQDSSWNSDLLKDMIVEIIAHFNNDYGNKIAAFVFEYEDVNGNFCKQVEQGMACCFEPIKDTELNPCDDTLIKLQQELQRQTELRRIEWNKFQALKSELKALLEKYE